MQDRERLLRDMGLAQESDALAVAEAEASLAAAHRAVDAANAAIDHIVERFERGKLTEEDYDRFYPQRCEARETARRQRADALAAGLRWNEVEQFFMDMQAEFEEADAPTPAGLQKRAAIIRRLVVRVEIYPHGRKRIVGALRCVTGEVPERVADGSFIRYSCTPW